MIPQEMSRDHTIELLAITEDLPTLPDRFLKIQHVIKDPNSSSADIAKIIQTDQATAVMVMKVANSPAYNPMNKPISSLSQAIARIGTHETANIALSMSLLYGFAIPGGIATIRSFWTHAYAVALLCKHLTAKLPKELKAPKPETMFLAGLFHDIGKAILGIRIDLSYFERQEFRAFGMNLIEAEKAAYGMDHMEVGQLILSRWGISDEISHVVADHHSGTTHTGAKICAIADLFANEQLANCNSIEAAHITLTSGLLEKAEELLIKEGLLPEPEEDAAD